MVSTLSLEVDKQSSVTRTFRGLSHLEWGRLCKKTSPMSFSARLDRFLASQKPPRGSLLLFLVSREPPAGTHTQRWSCTDSHRCSQTQTIKSISISWCKGIHSSSPQAIPLIHSLTPSFCHSTVTPVPQQHPCASCHISVSPHLSLLCGSALPHPPLGLSSLPPSWVPLPGLQPPGAPSPGRCACPLLPAPSRFPPPSLPPYLPPPPSPALQLPHPSIQACAAAASPPHTRQSRARPRPLPLPGPQPAAPQPAPARGPPYSGLGAPPPAPPDSGLQHRGRRQGAEAEAGERGGGGGGGAVAG